MKRTVSIIERTKAGKLVVRADREVIDCDDDFSGVDKRVKGYKTAGATAVLVLLEDDSVSRHWTAPAGEPKS